MFFRRYLLAGLATYLGWQLVQYQPDAHASLPKAHTAPSVELDAKPHRRGSPATAAERHCMVQTALGEATPWSRVEAIAIMRGMLKRRAMGRWGRDLCKVAKAHKQYSCFNGRTMPGKPRKLSNLYRQYDAWASVALAMGPSRHAHYWHGKTMQKLYRQSRPYWARACVERVNVGAATFCRMRNT